MNNQFICDAGEYYIASILNAREMSTNLVLGRRNQGYDLIVVNKQKVPMTLQVKTQFKKNATWYCSDGDTTNIAKSLFYVFIRLHEHKKIPEYWILPSKIACEFMANQHILWLKRPGKKGQKHNDNPGRGFRVTTGKGTPKNWTKYCEQFYMEKGLKLLEER